MFHMKLFVGAKALIVSRRKVLLLREAAYDEGTNEGMWDVPGGRIGSHEPLLEGMAREIQEETGLEYVRVGDVLGVFESFSVIKGEESHILRVYCAAYIEAPAAITLSADHDLYEWVSLEDLTDKQLMSNLKELVHKVLG
jgi:8-oxo-dGTP diphosphatase